jgi:hypothetical protein
MKMWDRYVKVVLTVIAVSLLWLCVRGTPKIASAAVAESSKVVRAESFELVDGEGRARGGLAVRRDGGVELKLVDKGGKIRSEIRLDEKGHPILRLWGKDETCVGLGILSDERPYFTLYDKDGKPRVGLRIVSDGNAGLVLCDKNRTIRVAVNLQDDLGPNLRLIDQEERVLWKAP